MQETNKSKKMQGTINQTHVTRNGVSHYLRGFPTESRLLLSSVTETPDIKYLQRWDGEIGEKQTLDRNIHKIFKDFYLLAFYIYEILP